jgi:hypothetical protein
LTVAELFEFVQSYDKNITEEFLPALSNYIFPAAKKLFQAAIEENASIIHKETNQNSIKSAERKIDAGALHEQLNSVIQANYDHIIVFHSAIQGLSSINNKSNPSVDLSRLQKGLEFHLIKTLGCSVFDSLLHYEAYNNGIQLSNSEEKQPQDLSELISSFQSNLNAAQREALFTQLPSKFQAVTQGLLDQIKSAAASTDKDSNNSSLVSFLASLESSFLSAGSIRLKRIDKKSQRNVIFSLRKAFLNDLSEAKNNEQLIFQYTVLLLHNRITGDMLHAPLRLIPFIFKFIKPAIQPLIYAKLRRFYKLTTALSKANADNSTIKSANVDSDSEMDNYILLSGEDQSHTAAAVAEMNIDNLQAALSQEAAYVKAIGLDTAKALIAHK